MFAVSRQSLLKQVACFSRSGKDEVEFVEAWKYSSVSFVDWILVNFSRVERLDFLRMVWWTEGVFLEFFEFFGSWFLIVVFLFFRV